MILAFAAETILWKRNKLKALDSLFANALWRMIFVVAAFLIVWIFTDNIFEGMTWGSVGLAFLIQIFGSTAIIAWSQTMKNMAVSLAQPLSLFRIIPLTLVSLLLFPGETSLWEILLVTGIAIFCFSLGFFQGRLEVKSTKDGNYKKGILYLLLWIVCFVSIDLIVMWATRTEVNPVAFSAVRVVAFFMVATAIFLILKKGGRREAIIAGFKNRNMMFIGVCFAVSSLLFIVLLTGMDNVGVLSALVVASVPLVVLYGVIFNKDRIKWYSYLLIAATVASVVVLSVISS